MNKKILFLEPMGAYANVFSKFMRIPLLGPIGLASIAKHAGFDVSIINENILDRKILKEELEDIDILLISCITNTINRGKKIAKEYKQLRESNGLESRVIIGGIHASMLPDDVMEDFDQIVIGEAEDIILDVLSEKIKAKVVYGNKCKNLDTLPLNNFKLTKEWEKINIWPVATSRGCPYNCNFCSVTAMFGRKYRTRSIENVMEEIISYDNGMIFFIDDHFVARPKRTDKMMDMMINYGFKRNWSAQMRTEVSRNTRLVEKMRHCGCKTVYIGFESINPQSLKEWNKGQSLKDIKHTIKVFKGNDIQIHGMFMLGSDSDTEEIFKTTSDFCIENGVDYVQYMILTPFPGTELYLDLDKQGRILHKNWDLYDALHTVFKPKNVSPKTLQEGMIDCFKNFYTYFNGINDALNAVFNIPVTFVKKLLHKKGYYNDFFPAIMKFIGKNIVKKWIKHNKPYLNYLTKMV